MIQINICLCGKSIYLSVQTVVHWHFLGRFSFLSFSPSLFLSPSVCLFRCVRHKRLNALSWRTMTTGLWVQCIGLFVRFSKSISVYVPFFVFFYQFPSLFHRHCVACLRRSKFHRSCAALCVFVCEWIFSLRIRVCVFLCFCAAFIHFLADYWLCYSHCFCAVARFSMAVCCIPFVPFVNVLSSISISTQ